MFRTSVLSDIFEFVMPSFISFLPAQTLKFTRFESKTKRTNQHSAKRTLKPNLNTPQGQNNNTRTLTRQQDKHVHTHQHTNSKSEWRKCTHHHTKRKRRMQVRTHQLSKSDWERIHTSLTLFWPVLEVELRPTLSIDDQGFPKSAHRQALSNRNDAGVRLLSRDQQIGWFR